MKKVFILIIIFVTTIAFAQNAGNNTTGKDDNKNTKVKLSDGFEKVKWGTLLSKAKDIVKGKPIFTDNKTIIITKLSEIRYYYGFFNIDRNKMEKIKGKGNVTDDAGKEGKLFYVAIKFPYLQKETILKKLTSKYGKPTNERIIDEQGAITWDSDKTMLILWIDRYEDKQYCRRITYISKDIAKEVNTYVKDYFYYIEKNTEKNVP